MRKFSSLSQAVRALFFGTCSKELVKDESRGGKALNPPAAIPPESPSTESVSPDEGLLACPEIEKEEKEGESSMANQRPWDIGESIMLLEAYLKIEMYPSRRHVILKQLSADLRARAEKSGMKIDAVFRNVNGMNLQYERFRYMMTDGKHGFRGPIPKNFLEARVLYEKNRPAYEKILQEARPVEEETAPVPPAAPTEALKPVEEVVAPKEATKPAEEVVIPKEEKKEVATFSTRHPWDRWEWALLLEAYEEIQKDPTAKMDILQKLSDILRARAIRLDMKIDDTSRNLNEVKLQYEQVLYVMTSGQKGLKGNLSKVFAETQNIYLTDKDWFAMLLRKAKRDAGIEMVEEVKKKAPITVVDGKVVRVEAPIVDFSAISLKGIASIFLYRGIYALHLTSLLRAKLNNQKIQNMQDLAYYMKKGEGKELSLAEQEEIFIKLKKYLDEHRSTGKVDFSSLLPSPSEEEVKKEVEIPAPVTPKVAYTPPKPSPRLGSISEAPPSFGKEEKKEEPVEDTKKPVTRKKRHVSSLVDLLSLESLEQDTPVSFSLQGRRVSVESWDSLYIHSLKYLLSKYREVFTSLRAQSMYIEQDYRLVRKEYQRKLRKPTILGQDFYAETDLAASAMLTYLKKVLERCGIDQETFIIETNRSEPVEVSSADDVDEKQLSCDLGKRLVYDGLMPQAFSYFGEKQDVHGWEDLLSKCASLLYEDYPRKFQELRRECERGVLPHYLSDSPGMGRTVKLGNRMYLHMGFTSKRIWAFLRYVLEKCQVDFENLVVEFAPPDNKPSPSPVVTETPEPVEKPMVATAPVEPEKPQEIEVPSSEENTLAAQIHHVLESHFLDGFAPMRINAKKFKRKLEETYGQPIAMAPEDLLVEICKVGEKRTDGRIYAKAGEKEREILQDVANALVALFDGGATVVYRDAFYEKYREELAKLAIYNASAMEDELKKGLPSGISCSYGAYRGKGVREDGVEIIDFIKASPAPIPDADILSKFWYIPKVKIDKLLNSEKKILHQKSTRFYYPNLSMTDGEKEGLRKRLLKEIWQKNFLGDADILHILAEDFPGIYSDVATFPPAVVRWALPLLYPNDFCIVGGNLSDMDHRGSAGQALQDVCKKYTRLTESQLAALRAKINFKGNYANVVMEVMVRISSHEWVRRDQIHWNPTIPGHIAKAMEGKECIPIQEISGFLDYPLIGVKWNLYVLESYLYKNDGLCPFQLLQASQVSASGVYGVIARRGSAIGDYEAAVIHLLARDDGWNTEKEALDRIVAMGLQSDRRMKNIEQITKAAKEERIRLKQ